MKVLGIFALMFAATVAHAGESNRQFCRELGYRSSVAVLNSYYGTPQFVTERNYATYQCHGSTQCQDRQKLLKLAIESAYDPDVIAALQRVDESDLLRLVAGVNEKFRRTCLRVLAQE